MISKEAIEEMKQICSVVHNIVLSDGEAQEIGNRIVRFLHAKGSMPEERPCSDQEQKAFTFIKGNIEKGNVVTVRAVASAAGFSSSRSGRRMIEVLISKTYIVRDGFGVLALVPQQE